MAQSVNKTQQNSADVSTFIGGIADKGQRADAQKIADMMARLTGSPPRMWGPSIVGFGRYRYRYDSGREGEMCRIGFSPRKANTVLYIIDGFAGHSNLLAKLGKHKIGKSCLYIKKLTDIDDAVLEQLCTESLAWMAEKYPEDAG